MTEGHICQTCHKELKSREEIFKHNDNCNGPLLRDNDEDEWEE